jgi:hypothetical protein
VPRKLALLAASLPPTGLNLHTLSGALLHVATAIVATTGTDGRLAALATATGAHCIEHLVRATEVGDYAAVTAGSKCSGAQAVVSAAADIFGGDSDSETPAPGHDAAPRVQQQSLMSLQEFAASVAFKALCSSWSSGSAAVLSAKRVAAFAPTLLGGAPVAPEDTQALCKYLVSNRAFLASIIAAKLPLAGDGEAAVHSCTRLLDAVLQSKAVDSTLAMALLLGLGPRSALPLLRRSVQQAASDFQRMSLLGCLGLDAATMWTAPGMMLAAGQLLTKARWWQALTRARVKVDSGWLQESSSAQWTLQGTSGGKGGESFGGGSTSNIASGEAAANLVPAVCQLSKFDVETVRHFCSSCGVDAEAAYTLCVQLLLSHEGTLDMCTSPGVGRQAVLPNWQGKLAAFVNLLPEETAVRVLEVALPCVCGLDYARLGFVLTMLTRY